MCCSKTIRVRLDVLVLATGSDSGTGGLTQIDIRGVSGQTLADTWRGSVRMHLGLSAPNFPNPFILYGPQSPTAFWNGPTSTEVQGEWVVKCLCHMQANGCGVMEATQAAAERWAAHIRSIADGSLLPLADSWHMGTNTPGRPGSFFFIPVRPTTWPCATKGPTLATTGSNYASPRSPACTAKRGCTDRSADLVGLSPIQPSPAFSLLIVQGRRPGTE